MKFTTSETHIKIVNENGDLDLCSVEGTLQVKLKTGKWVNVRKLSKLEYPVTMRFDFQ